jgi:hypothetical protein
MRKILLVAAVASVSLGACTSTQFAQFDDLAAKIQSYAVNACRYEPTLVSVTALIAAFFPGGTIPTGAIKLVGDAICKAPEPASAAFAAAGPVNRSSSPATRIVATPRGKVVVSGVRK